VATNGERAVTRQDASSVSPLLEFDSVRVAVIEPSSIIGPIDIAEHCKRCYFQEVIAETRARGRPGTSSPHWPERSGRLQCSDQSTARLPRRRTHTSLSWRREASPCASTEGLSHLDRYGIVCDDFSPENPHPGQIAERAPNWQGSAVQISAAPAGSLVSGRLSRGSLEILALTRVLCGRPAPEKRRVLSNPATGANFSLFVGEPDPFTRCRRFFDVREISSTPASRERIARLSGGLLESSYWCGFCVGI
jgi:hypothetical protein